MVQGGEGAAVSAVQKVSLSAARSSLGAERAWNQGSPNFAAARISAPHQPLAPPSAILQPLSKPQVIPSARLPLHRDKHHRREGVFRRSVHGPPGI